MNILNLSGFFNQEDNLNKGGLPEGTIKDWKGGKFIKQNGKWIPYQDPNKPTGIKYIEIEDGRSNEETNLNNLKFLQQELNKKGFQTFFFKDQLGNPYLNVNLGKTNLSFIFDQHGFSTYEGEQSNTIQKENDNFNSFLEQNEKYTNYSPKEFIKQIQNYSIKKDNVLYKKSKLEDISKMLEEAGFDKNDFTLELNKEKMFGKDENLLLSLKDDVDRRKQDKVSKLLKQKKIYHIPKLFSKNIQSQMHIIF